MTFTIPKQKKRKKRLSDKEKLFIREMVKKKTGKIKCSNADIVMKIYNVNRNKRDMSIERTRSIASGIARQNLNKLHIIEAIERKVRGFSGQLDEIVQNSIKDLKNKQKNASYKDNIHAIKEMTVLKRLIEDKSTENKAISISNVLDNL